MADETKAQVEAAAQAPATIAKAVADSTTKVVEQTAKAQKNARARSKRRVKKAETATRAVRKTVRKTARKAQRRTAAKPAGAAAKERNTAVNYDPKTFFQGFAAIPGTAPLQSMFAEANERGQETARRSQKATEDLVAITRANVEALIDAGRIASEGSRSIAQDVVAKSRKSVEQTADVVRSLAEAKSPTEFIQLQTEFARASFDRAVAESSRLTESLVKLAGEAIQPISNRATANAVRLNEIVA